MGYRLEKKNSQPPRHPRIQTEAQFILSSVFALRNINVVIVTRCCKRQIVGSEERKRWSLHDEGCSSDYGMLLDSKHFVQQSSVCLGRHRLYTPNSARLWHAACRPENSQRLLVRQTSLYVLHTADCHLDHVLLHHLQNAQDLEYSNNSLFLMSCLLLRFGGTILSLFSVTLSRCFKCSEIDSKFAQTSHVRLQSAVFPCSHKHNVTYRRNLAASCWHEGSDFCRVFRLWSSPVNSVPGYIGPKANLTLTVTLGNDLTWDYLTRGRVDYHFFFHNRLKIFTLNVFNEISAEQFIAFWFKFRF